jgi:hypothetical protein
VLFCVQVRSFDGLNRTDMRSITDPAAHASIIARLISITPLTARVWGRMTPAQMLLHCRNQIGLGTGDVSAKAMFPSPVQWLAKQTFGFVLPWSRNLPTAPEMVAYGHDGLDFNGEMNALRDSISAFVALPEDAHLEGHPIFGKMSKDEWGKIIYKHLDHHLRQFGA